MLVDGLQEFLGELYRHLNFLGFNRVIRLCFDMSGVISEEPQFVGGLQKIVRDNDCRPKRRYPRF